MSHGGLDVLGHDQTNSRSGAIARLAAVACFAAALSACARAPAQAVSAEDVRLSGDRVSRWVDADGVGWVLLEGEAAILQNGEGLRADAILARITQSRRVGRGGFQIEAHAEGRARTSNPDDPPARSRRVDFTTLSDPRLTAFRSAAIAKLDQPPATLPIRDRGFPPAEPVAAPATASAPVAAEPPPVVALGAPEPLAEPEPISEPLVETVQTAAQAAPKTDPAVQRTQDDGDGFAPPFPGPPDIDGDDLQGVPFDPGGINELEPLPGGLLGDGPVGPGVGAAIPAPLLPDSRRRFSVTGGPNFQIEPYVTEAGDITFVLRGRVNIVADLPKKESGPAKPGPAPYTTVDLTADNVVIWTRRSKKNPNAAMDPAAGIQQDADEPLQFYLEGDVRIRQDAREVAGKGDEKIFEAERAYFDARTERITAYNGRVHIPSPGLIAPLRTDAKIINQYREAVVGPDGRARPGPMFIRLDGTSTTGSRFPIPGYRFDSQSIEIEDRTVPLVDELDGGKVGPGNVPAQQDKLYEFRAFNSAYYLGRIPVFYLPYTSFTSDFDPILRNVRFQTGNVFGQSIQFDLSGFRLLGIQKPTYIDNWNIDADYLSYRGFGIGSELSWFGRDLIGEVSDPYAKDRRGRNVDHPYFGYLDLWGIKDMGRDILGPGPAVVTNGPANAGKAGFQRTSVPAFQDYRGRATFRHMMRFLGDDGPEYEDLRLQVEGSYLSDRNFLEEYYKRLFDTGLDQETLAYGIYQKQNRALTLMTEANLQYWYTDTQWLPKLEYTRLGDSLLNDWVNVSLRAGVDYANTHTATEVDNKNIVAFLPRDPVSNTTGTLKTGRLYSAAQVDVPLNLFDERLKVVPYVQGQLVGWDNQLGYQPLGRAWGAYGIKASLLAWRTFEGEMFESELLNIHGLAHKINLQADYRSAYSNQPLSRIGVQDDLDDNTYEWTRRYFALTNFVGGLLPAQYDPRLLTLRRQVSPISGTTDVQDTIQTLRLGIHQRLQTKRGPEGKRRIIDYMTFDLDTTYFPNADRDNFGKPFGQNTYNYEWFLGDRTSFVSYGWFEFWKVAGQAIASANPSRTNDPFGLNVITSGFSINRPPRGSVFIGYSIINTGPIDTSALNFSFTYWLSPKWYTYVGLSYDFGNQILLGTTFSLTKITKDYLTSLGLNVDPQRMNYTFAFEISPRFSPNVRIGSTAGQRFDSRFAPSQ